MVMKETPRISEVPMLAMMMMVMKTKMLMMILMVMKMKKDMMMTQMVTTLLMNLARALHGPHGERLERLHRDGLQAYIQEQMLYLAEVYFQGL